VSVTLADGRSLQGDVVIGADGIHSRVRAVTFGDEAPRYSGFTAWRGIVPLDDMLASRIHPAESRRRGGLFGLTRLGGSQAFWYAIARARENAGWLADGEKAMLLRRFGYWHDPIPELIEATAVEPIVRTSLYDRPPLARWAAGANCASWGRSPRDAAESRPGRLPGDRGWRRARGRAFVHRRTTGAPL
jgi:2-polyprenyl-6-methoxyphenol hydroxylase-like FAD-dependent oxidoreductase